MPAPRLYTDLAAWWPLFSSPVQDDYGAEADWIRDALNRTLGRDPSDILELGSGGGNTASHLRSRARLTLVDLSDEMLNVSRRLNPGVEHVQGDMRSVRLGKTVQAVLIHDAIDYMTTELKGVPVQEPAPPEGVVNLNGEWYFEEYARGAGVSSVGLDEKAPTAPTEEERNSILDLFRRKP